MARTKQSQRRKKKEPPLISDYPQVEKKPKIEDGSIPSSSALSERLLRCQEPNTTQTTTQHDALHLSAELLEAAEDAAFLLEEAISDLEMAIHYATPLAIDQPPVAATEEQGRELIAYAHRLSFTTSAPPGFVPGQSPLMHFKPPAPQDFQLRSSVLHQFQREYEIKQKAGERVTAYATAAAAATLPEPTTTATTAAAAALPSLPAEKAPVNLGDILSNLPPMPEGWKPGDAIPGLTTTTTTTTTAAPASTTQPGSTVPKKVSPAGVGGAGVSRKEPQKAAAAAPPSSVTRPVSAAFDFALNPDMEMVFEEGDTESESESDSDSD